MRSRDHTRSGSKVLIADLEKKVGRTPPLVGRWSRHTSDEFIQRWVGGRSDSQRRRIRSRKVRCELQLATHFSRAIASSAAIVTKSRTGFFFVARNKQQQQNMRCKFRRYPVTPCNFSSGLQVWSSKPGKVAPWLLQHPWITLKPSLHVPARAWS